MKASLNTPINYVQRNKDAEQILKGETPNAAVAARLIQMTATSNPLKDAMGFEGQRLAVSDLVRYADVGEERKTAVLAVVNSTLKAAAKLTAEHRETFLSAAIGKPRSAPPSPSPTAARAFLAEFQAAGIAAGQRGAHDAWFVNAGPGAGRSFLETPRADAIEARAGEIAARKGVPVSEQHRITAADQLAREAKVTFGDADFATGRLFGLPYEKLERVGGFALQRANANNAAEIEAGLRGLLSHLSGDGEAVRGGSRPQAFGALPIDEQHRTLDYFRSVRGELAEHELGQRSRDELSPVARTADATPLFFSLNGMVGAAEQSIRKTEDLAADAKMFVKGLHYEWMASTSLAATGADAHASLGERLASADLLEAELRGKLNEQGVSSLDASDRRGLIGAIVEQLRVFSESIGGAERSPYSSPEFSDGTKHRAAILKAVESRLLSDLEVNTPSSSAA